MVLIAKSRIQPGQIRKIMSKFKVGDTIRLIGSPKAEGIIDLVDGTFGYQVLWVNAEARAFHSQQWVDRYYELVPTEKAPAHYVEGRTIEPRSVVKDWELNWNLGNALKYVARCGRKGDAVEDLRKAITFLEFEIEDREGNG